MGAIVSRLTDATGRVDLAHRYLLVVRGPQDAVRRTVEEMDRQGKLCFREIRPENNGGFVGKVDFIPFESWVRRGGAVRELTGQLRWIAPSLTEISVYLTDARQGLGVSACDAFPLAAQDELVAGARRGVDTLRRAGSVVLSTVDRTTNTAINLADGAGALLEQTAEGGSLLARIFAITGPLGGIALLLGAAYLAVQLYPPLRGLRKVL